MTGDGTNDRGAQPPRTLFSLGREGSRRRRGGTDVAEVEAEPERPAPVGEPCVDCGAELIVGAAFCGECGTAVATADLIDEDLELDEDGAAADLIDEDLALDEEFEIDEEVLLEADLVDDDLVDDDDLEARSDEELVDDLAVDDDLLDEELVAEDDPDPAAEDAATDDADDGKKVAPGLALVGGAAVAGAATKNKRRGKKDDPATDDPASDDPASDDPASDDTAEEAESGLAVLAAARAQGPPLKAPKPEKAPKADKGPGGGKRAPIGWIIGGIAAAILIVVGVVALTSGGSDDKSDVASSEPSTTTTRQSTTTSTAVTTTTQATTTTTEEATTTSSAAPATQAPQTTIINTGPVPEGPKTPPALRVAGVTCPLGSNPCTISVGGTLTVTLVNDGGLQGAYSLSGPGLQGPNDELTLDVPHNKILDVLTFLRDDGKCRFEVLIDICVVDWPARENRFDVVYHLLSPRLNQRIRVKLKTDETTPVASAIAIFSAANWFEREAYDMYGILFSAIPTCAACSPIMASRAILCARTSRSRATSRCATTKSSSAWSTSPSS